MRKMLRGEPPEHVAEQYKISREEQDHYGLGWQTGAARAIESGRFNEEIVPVRPESKRVLKLSAAMSILLSAQPLRKCRSCSPFSPRLAPSPRAIPRVLRMERRPWF